VKFSFVGLFTIVFFAASLSQAGAFSVTQLDPGQVDPFFKTMAADLAFRPVQPAASYGLWGISAGLTGISTSTTQSSALANSGTTSLYAGDVSLGVGIPFGIAIEVGLLPTLSTSGSSFARLGGDVKWTFTDVLSKGFFDGAVRAMYTNASIGTSQSANGGNINLNYSTTITGANLSLSKSLLFLDPYISYGLAQQVSNLSETGSGNIFNNSFAPGTSSVASNSSSGWFQLGVQLKLLLLTAAIEYDNLFGSDSYAARVGLTF
jgi:hypothetical protein